MKTWMKTLYITIFAIFLIYLLLPNTSFPIKLEDSLQSDEPADTETKLRRAYFTNNDRSGVLKHYQEEFRIHFIPNYRLNYPPEEAQVFIRDQTRSTYLEEIVYPFRESLFVNGFEPKTEKDTIIINNLHWEQKVIVRHIPSNRFARVVIGVLIAVLGWYILLQWIEVVKLVSKSAIKIIKRY
jgi:hypothetical protein